MAIDFYSKWFEVKDVPDHTAFVDVEFLEVEMEKDGVQNVKTYVRCTMGLFVNI